MQEKDYKNQDVVLESASALMDGEASELDLRRVLKAVGNEGRDEGLAATWKRYHLVRASLQQEMHSRPEVDLLAGIHARLAADELPAGRSVSARLGAGLRRIGQGAVAASVAFTVLYAASYLQNNSDDAATMAVAAAGGVDAGSVASDDARLPSLGGDFTPSELTRTVSMDAAARKRLQQAVYQSSRMEKLPFGEPYVFPQDDVVEDIAAPAITDQR